MTGMLNARELFLFDVQGFLVFPGALCADEVSGLNRALASSTRLQIDSPLGTGYGASSALEGTRRRRGLGVDPLRLAGDDGAPFRRLVAHRSVRPCLDSVLGHGWRLDSTPEVILADPGADGLTMHGSGSGRFSPVTYYVCTAGTVRCGFVTVEYALSDAGPGAGGFVCIPGSHKAQFDCPLSIRTFDADADLIHQPVLRAGDALVFTEALIHGTRPWRAQHQRRVVMYRYTPKVAAVAPPAAGYGQADLEQEWAADLSDAERLALQPPFLPDRPVICDDGEVRRRTEWF